MILQIGMTYQMLLLTNTDYKWHSQCSFPWLSITLALKNAATITLIICMIACNNCWITWHNLDQLLPLVTWMNNMTKCHYYKTWTISKELTADASQEACPNPIVHGPHHIFLSWQHGTAYNSPQNFLLLIEKYFTVWWEVYNERDGER